jgi:hypothetical protein
MKARLKSGVPPAVRASNSFQCFIAMVSGGARIFGGKNKKMRGAELPWCQAIESRGKRIRIGMGAPDSFDSPYN